MYLLSAICTYHAYIQCGVLSGGGQIDRHSAPLLDASASTALEEAFVVVGGKRSRLGRRSARSGEGTEEEQAICNIRFGSPAVQRDRGDGGEEQAR